MKPFVPIVHSGLPSTSEQKPSDHVVLSTKTKQRLMIQNALLFLMHASLAIATWHFSRDEDDDWSAGWMPVCLNRIVPGTQNSFMFPIASVASVTMGTTIARLG